MLHIHAMSERNAILEAKSVYVSTFGEKRTLPLAPAWRLAVLTCMNARLVPAKFAGLQEGDTHVIRIAGGSCQWRGDRRAP